MTRENNLIINKLTCGRSLSIEIGKIVSSVDDDEGDKAEILLSPSGFQPFLLC